MRRQIRSVAVVGTVALVAAAAIGAGPGTAMAATDTQASTVEDGNYPGAAAIEAAQNVQLISGDGHIVLADCATAPVNGIGVMRVDTTDMVGPDGAGEVCFKATASSGVLNLTLPAVYSIRGDGYPAFSGNGHDGTALVTTDDGVQTTVPLKRDQSTQVGISADPPGPPTTLLQLRVGAGLAPVTGTNPAVGKLDAGGRGCTATLIRSDWIVTAASCLADNPDQPSVPAGAPTRDTHVVFPGHDPVAVTVLVPRGDRDMVMGKLGTAIGGITPAKLSNLAPVNNGTLQETGYGRTATVWAPDTQQTATVTATGVTGTAVTGNVTGGLVCKGDAGSPAFNDQGQVVAINSRAGQAGCLDASSTDTEVTDTRLDNIVDWMRLNTFETTVSPVLSTESDGWHVDASLPGVNRFEFVVKTAGQADAYYGDQTSPFLIPLSYTGKAVFVGARAEGSGTPWAAGVTETVPAAVPKLSVEPDGWHVDASLPGVDHFMFVVKVAGQPDVYTDNQTSPFLVDPSTYGGKSVSVSARAAGPATNPWGAAVTDVVPAAVPKLTVEPDGWHVDASLPGVDHFVFVVKVAGQPDVYTLSQTSPFLVDPWIYGGKSVSVSARAAGPATNPWGSAVAFTVLA